jgi:hypothetical protein
VFASYEHGLAGDSVHVETSSSFEVVEVNETVFGDEVDDTVSFRDLHSDGEIVGSFRREEDIDSFLGVNGVGGGVIDFDDVKLLIIGQHREK